MARVETTGTVPNKGLGCGLNHWGFGGTQQANPCGRPRRRQDVKERTHYRAGGTTKLPSEITAKTCHNYAKITDMRNREKQIERQSILACIPFLKFPIVWQKHQFHPISTSKPPTQTSGMVLGWYGWPWTIYFRVLVKHAHICCIC